MEKTGKSAGMKYFLFLFLTPLLLMGESLNVHISFTGTPMLSVRTITNAFNAIGYRLEIDTLESENTSGSLSATALGTKPFNSPAFGENLKKQGIGIEKAHLKMNELTLVLETQNGRWDVPLLGSEDGAELARANTAQWFRLEEGSAIRIQPPYVSKWYPEVAVFDLNLELLSSYRSLEPKDELEFELPAGARYVKISNAQGMKLLKEGMWVESMRLGR